MSENLSLSQSSMIIEQGIDEEYESKLSLVIRKVQEGKTYICITNITNDRTKNIHIVLTMNTLASGMQFFGRMEETIGCHRIIVFNSKKKTAYISETTRCHHAKDVSSIFTIIRRYPDVKVIVCCAHEKRIRESIPEFFTQASEMSSFATRKFIIHIDEAHKYIPENDEHIREFNGSPVVKSIIGYSGSPNGIWSSHSEDPLFHKILIRDIEQEFNIIRSPQYFSIHSCEHIVIETERGFNAIKMIADAQIGHTISEFAWIHADMSVKNRPTWYGEKFHFDLGNEILFLSFLKYILERMEISSDCFSYHFVPAYTRKATHYQTVEIIHSLYPTANVIVMNGNGMSLFRLVKSHITDTLTSSIVLIDKTVRQNATPEEQRFLLEPSYMVEKLIEHNSECPTFITGQTCVGMSVTLINQQIGNFDNVIMAHQQFSADKLYQLCRFLFNFASWSKENREKIKKTKIYSLTKHVIDTCVKYEEDVEHMSSEFAGKTCSLREIQGLDPEEPSKNEEKKRALNSIQIINSTDLWKKFKVYGGNDEEQWDNVNLFYREKTGKDIPSRSRPKKINPNKEESLFYHCSTTGPVGIQKDAIIKRMANQSWYSTFQLTDKLKYARIFVGYEDLEDPKEYTIYIKHVQLHDSENTRKILNKYGKKNESKSDEDD